jgi:hypothetical protein
MNLFLNKAYINGIVKHGLTKYFHEAFGRMVEHFEIPGALLEYLVSQIEKWCPGQLGKIRGEFQFRKSRTPSLYAQNPLENA